MSGVGYGHVEYFIECIKRYPCLWNKDLEEYKDYELKDEAWRAVTRKNNLPNVNASKSKWKKLRDCYREAMKKRRGTSAQPRSNRKLKLWKYERVMSFLAPYMTNRQSETICLNITVPEDDGPAFEEVDIESADGSDSIMSLLDESSDTRRSFAEEPSSSHNHTVTPTIPEKGDSDATPADPQKRQIQNLDRTPFVKSEQRLTIKDTWSNAQIEKHSYLDHFFTSMCEATRSLPFQSQLRIKRTLFECVTKEQEIHYLNSQAKRDNTVRTTEGPHFASNLPPIQRLKRSFSPQ